MKQYDVIIIGSGPSGIITGVTGKQQNPEKTFLMITKDKIGLVPCGIPYVFHDIEVPENKMGPKPFVDAGGKVLVDSVTKVDTEKKIVKTESGQDFQFQKLVFATGSIPVLPKFIKGYDLEGVEYIKKNYDYIESLKQKTNKAKNIVIIGGGFIGVEIAEQLAKYSDKSVSLVEVEKYCLYKAFSPDIAEIADATIRTTAIKLYTGNKVQEIIGENGKVKAVKLESGQELDADLVISSVGYKPNTELAKEAGLEINSNNAIRCDNYLRTGKKDIYAVGDCAQTTGFITGRTDYIMLASTATAEARILGYNLYNINILRNFVGTLSVFSTEIGGKSFASAGAIEQSAEEANIAFVTGTFKDADRHPGAIKDCSELLVKLIVSTRRGVIIGGEIYGGKSVGELINVIGLAIQKEVTVYELLSYQIGTHPLLTAAPTKYVLIKAAEMAIKKLNNK